MEAAVFHGCEWASVQLRAERDVFPSVISPEIFRCAIVACCDAATCLSLSLSLLLLKLSLSLSLSLSLTLSLCLPLLLSAAASR